MASSDKDTPTPEDQGVHTAARREKLEKIRQLGIDPWGGRFDDRMLIRELRAQADQVRYQLENGDQLELPELDEDPEKRINLRHVSGQRGESCCNVTRGNSASSISRTGAVGSSCLLASDRSETRHLNWLACLTWVTSLAWKGDSVGPTRAS